MSRKPELSRNLEFEGGPPKSTRSRPPRLGRAVKIMYFKCAWPPTRQPLCRHGHRYINEKKSRLVRGPRKEKKSVEVFSHPASCRGGLWFSPHAQKYKPFRGLASLPLGFVPSAAFSSCSSGLSPLSLPGPPDARSFLPESNRETVQGNTLPTSPAPPPSRPKPSAIPFGNSQSAQRTICGSSFERGNPF